MEKLPESLKTECLVRTKVGADEKVLKERQELTKTRTPAELSEIRGLSDLPIPTFKKRKQNEGLSEQISVSRTCLEH